MAWTTPANYTTGYLITASDWNTQVRDNMEWLKAPPSNRMAIVTQNTTSTSFAAVTGVSLAITLEGGRLQVSLVCTMYNSGLNNNFLDIGIDGTGQGDATNGLTFWTTPVATYRTHIGFTWVSPTTLSGSKTVTLRWKTQGGTLTMENGGQFSVREV